MVDCYPLATVLNHMKLQGAVVKQGTKWLCLGEEFKTLAAIEQRYNEDLSYQQALQQLVVDNEIASGQSIPPQEP